MATATDTASARHATNTANSDRKFYSGIAIAFGLTAFAGFAPTYYLRSAFGSPPTVTGATTLTTLAQVHGAVFTAWVALFVIQTALVASHRTRVHRRLGVAGAVLAVAMVFIGVTTATAAAARGSAPPGADALAFLAVPFFDMVLFAFFVGAALWRRRDREAHKRLMLLAYVSIITAAVARLPGVLPYGPFVFYAMAFVFLLAGVIYDLVSRRSVHPTYRWGGALLIASVPGRLLFSGTAAWRAFAELLTR